MNRKVSLPMSVIAIIVSFIGGLFATQTVETGKTVTIDATQIEYYFTRAGDKPEQALIRVIDHAQETLDIAIYSLTHPDIVGAIRDAAKRGVKVRLIEDKQQAGGKSQTEALKLLGSAGVQLKVNKHSGLMHLKTTIADGKVVTGGSFNYSKSASTNSDEVLTIYRSQEIAEDFSRRFEAMWSDDARFEDLERYIAMREEASSPSNQEQQEPEPAKQSDRCEEPLIKGNLNSKIYHVPGGQNYEQTSSNIEMFCTEQEAEAAGYRKAAR